MFCLIYALILLKQQVTCLLNWPNRPFCSVRSQSFVYLFQQALPGFHGFYFYVAPGADFYCSQWLSVLASCQTSFLFFFLFFFLNEQNDRSVVRDPLYFKGFPLLYLKSVFQSYIVYTANHKRTLSLGRRTISSSKCWSRQSQKLQTRVSSPIIPYSIPNSTHCWHCSVCFQRSFSATSLEDHLVYFHTATHQIPSSYLCNEGWVSCVNDWRLDVCHFFLFLFLCKFSIFLINILKLLFLNGLFLQIFC